MIAFTSPYFEFLDFFQISKYSFCRYRAEIESRREHTASPISDVGSSSERLFSGCLPKFKREDDTNWPKRYWKANHIAFWDNVTDFSPSHGSLLWSLRKVLLPLESQIEGHSCKAELLGLWRGPIDKAPLTSSVPPTRRPQGRLSLVLSLRLHCKQL